ncbi:vacuolar protein sorting-associated protein 72 homolog [Diadema setosum]|uniref:vacuolar protein sorting-associated protein 72 homolog n=1 Tax=Diadema setosum TaxID=31175 RepID=UPI003B3A0E21
MSGLAKTRERRANAGSQMHRLLAEEQEDEFYKTTYGGFEEESGDEEYSSEESEAETSSDSDIDAPEDDEVISESDDEGQKRKRRVITKAYKEPPKKPAIKKASPDAAPKEKKEKSATPKSSRLHRRGRDYRDESVRKSTRRSTVQRVNEFEMRIKERETKARIMKQQHSRKNVPEMRRLTQEELLAEAKITEKKNLHSLYLFQQLEEEKKKTKVFKKAFTGPFIRFHSITMPTTPKIQEVGNINVDKVDKAEAVSSGSEKTVRTKVTEKCSRNFITYSDPQMFKDTFPRGKKRAQPKQLCPITRYPARYVDPVTGIPFATKQAYKIIRETYATEIAAAMSGEPPKRRSKSSASSSES